MPVSEIEALFWSHSREAMHDARVCDARNVLFSNKVFGNGHCLSKEWTHYRKFSSMHAV